MIVFKLQLASLLLLFSTLSSALTQDGLSLLALKAAIDHDPTRSLDSWSESDSTPCRWVGIACTHGRVTSLSLPNKGFTGYIPSELGLLDTLTRLVLSRNHFSKPIPPRLFNATGLLYLDLSQNSLTGPVPAQIRGLRNLAHLDLSSNLLNGSLPESLSDLKNLSGTLNLSSNRFSGEIPSSYGFFPVFVSLDLRHNNLTGKVPQVGSLLNQGPTAFFGNPNLCGFPLQTPCLEAQNPKVVPQNSENLHKPQNPNASLADDGERREKGSSVFPLISGISVVIAAVSLSVWLFWRKWGSREGRTRTMTYKEKEKEKEKGKFDVEGQNGKFVVIDEGFNMELEDMLRASAYVVGKSKSGIVYKVLVGKGTALAAVAVRRLSEGDAMWKLKEFESEVESIGKVHHPNIVRLRAYYYASDEKLLITDFIRNGSLHTALHAIGGNSISETVPPLSWSERLRIAQGSARGLMYIHEHSPKRYIHGNLKSTKILLDDERMPYISGFGLTCLVSKLANPVTKKQNLHQQSLATNAYMAPESRVNKLTQKSDVYSFGIILLEILTGRLPDGLESLVRKAFREEHPLAEIIDPALLDQVHARKQVIAAFHLALNCTEVDPELRPRMRTVSDRLDHIKT